MRTDRDERPGTERSDTVAGHARRVARGEVAAEAPFILDIDSNPHPELLAGAIDAYEDAESIGFDPSDPATIYLRGMIRGMALATGRPDAEFVEWIKHHRAKAS